MDFDYDDQNKMIDVPNPVKAGFCDAVPHDGLSGRSLYGDREKKSLPSVGGACVYDGSGYWAKLVVHEDFGCVLFDES